VITSSENASLSIFTYLSWVENITDIFNWF
jgi:hypothetical protein